MPELSLLCLPGGLENNMPFPEDDMVKYVDLMINSKEEVSEER